MKRLTFLKATSISTVAGMTALAGCSSGSNESGNGSTGNASGEGTSGGSTGTSGGASTTQSGGGTAMTSSGTNGSTTGANGTAATSGGGGGTETVGMYTDGSTYYFDPIGLFVEPGTTVDFVIESGAHSATSYTTDNPSVSERRIPEGAESWDSGTISGSDSFEYTFETEGTYDYYCIPHKTLGMVGRVVCGSPGGPAEGSMPPDGDVPESSAIVEQGSIAFSDFS